MVELYGGDPIGSAALTEQGTYAVPSTTGQVLGASVREGFAAAPFLRSMRAAGGFAAETGIVGADEFGRPIQVEPEPAMDTDAANAEFGIPGSLKFDKPTPRSVAQDLYEHKREQILRQDIIDRREGGILTGGAARFVAEMAGGIPDPFNLATGFIPVVSQARQAALIASAAGAAERAATRFALGGAQGAAGMLALQPLEFALSRREQDDYTMADALRSIALGTVLGGGLHAGIGALGDRAAARVNPISRMLEESGPEVRQGLLRNALANMVDGRPVNLEPILDIADALRSREIARMTVREGGRDVDQALPGALSDPLVLARRGELTAERAAQIRDDLQTLTTAEIARAKAQIGEQVDPRMWAVIADNLQKAEASRTGATAVIADQLGYLGTSGQIRTASEREAAAVIGRAMQAEAARGGDVASLIDDAMRARHGEGAVPAEAAAQKQQLLDMHAAGAETLAARTPLVGGSIATDLAASLVAAGRPETEALAYGQLWQRVAERRAQAFRGLRGTAEDMYREAKPEIVRGTAGAPLQPGELAQRGVTGTVKEDNAREAARTDQGQALPGRVPTGKDAPADRLTDADAIPDLPTLESNERLFKNTVDAVAADPGMMEPGLTFATTREKAEYLIGRIVDNLRWLYDQVPPEIRERSKLWYDGAQAIATEWATRWGKTRAQTAGMLAVLSPQKDWFMNTSMAERIGDILYRQGDHRWDSLMDAQAFKFLVGETSSSPANRAAYAAIKDKTLREVVAMGDPVRTGMWLRAYDEAHHGPAHAIITPEGAYAGNVLTGAGEEARRAWGDFGAIGKAASIFYDGSPENISVQIGAEHKVRNFYNNIFNAGDRRYVTIDTHAVAADELRPVAGNDKAVEDNFGGTGSDRATGLKGSYALHAEAYRRLAEELGLLPREIQSITWEAVRGLFPDSWKTRANKEAVDAIWNRVGAGELSVEGARAEILALAGGVDPPTWVGQTAADHVQRTSTYPAERGAPAGAGITFEVAPDPRNAALVERWAAVPRAVQERISHSVAWQVATRALEGAGEALWGVGGKQRRPVALKGELHRNNGAWLDDSNPSLSLLLDQDISPAKAAILTRLLGYALGQEAMLRASPRPFPGGAETGAVRVQLPKDATPTQIHEVWRQIREIADENGTPYALGHTTGADGEMVILNNNDRAATIGTEDLARLIDEKLGGRYDVKDTSVFAELVEAGNDAYGLHGAHDARGVRGGPSQSSIRAAGDTLRAEAQQHLDEQLAAHERLTGGGAEPARPAAEPGPTAEPGAGPSPRGPPGELEQAGRAKVRLATDDTRALLTFFEDADATSAGHESWHIFTNELFDDALHPDAPPELIADAAALKRAVGAEEGGPLTREQQEQLAGWGEQYLREGRAPVPELQSLFDRFRAWFISVYETIAGLGTPISNEVRGIYDRMVALEGRPPEPRGPLKTPIPDNQPFARAPAAGEPGGPRATDTIAEINAQADELQRLQQASLGERPLSAESAAEAQAATEGAAEAEARASALEQAAVCMMRG